MQLHLTLRARTRGFINRIPEPVRLFLKIYILAILFFSSFRLILFLTELNRIDSTVSAGDILTSFLTGIRFDLVITGYIVIIPYILLTAISFLHLSEKNLRMAVFYYLLLMFTLAFLICSADIPYFNHFFMRLSITALAWSASPGFVLKMILEEPRYWLAAVPFVVSVPVFYYQVHKILFNDSSAIRVTPGYLKISLSLIFLCLIFFGIRGRLDEKSPIREGTAYFSNNTFLNQLGLNPVFTFFRSYLESRKPANRNIHLMDNREAVRNVRNWLGIPGTDMNAPLSRNVIPDTTGKTKYNVVVVIMESMGASKMKRNGNNLNLTPFLDSLSNEGCYFENAYTAGIHTYNGIFSTLFSFPAIFRQHPMKGTPIRKYQGLATTLRENGYSTIYFTTHDGQFDNVEGFLKENDYERIVSKADYPGEEIKTTLGVPDDFMFRFSIPILDDLHRNNGPFLAVFLTCSDHGPYYIPDYFTPKSDEITNQIVEYADYSLKKFMTMASSRDWFANTLFVFVADHGSPADYNYEMSVEYNHTPLLFYSPALIKTGSVHDDPAGQVDVFPTIMGLLKFPYTNNTMGIDLLKDKRPYMFFGADDKFGVIDHDYFLVVRDDGISKLYKYRIRDSHDYSGEMPGQVASMKLYAKSNLQTFQYILNTDKQSGR